MWPLRAARTRLDDRWARLGVVGPGCADLPSLRSCRRLTGLGWRHGAGAVSSNDGGDPAARDRTDVVERPRDRGEGAWGRLRVRCSKFLTGYNLASTVRASSPLNSDELVGAWPPARQLQGVQ